jgi:hypothetical protein
LKSAIQRSRASLFGGWVEVTPLRRISDIPHRKVGRVQVLGFHKRINGMFPSSDGMGLSTARLVVTKATSQSQGGGLKRDDRVCFAHIVDLPESGRRVQAPDRSLPTSPRSPRTRGGFERHCSTSWKDRRPFGGVGSSPVRYCRNYVRNRAPRKRGRVQVANSQMYDEDCSSLRGRGFKHRSRSQSESADLPQ